MEVGWVWHPKGADHIVMDSASRMGWAQGGLVGNWVRLGCIGNAMGQGGSGRVALDQGLMLLQGGLGGIRVGWGQGQGWARRWTSSEGHSQYLALAPPIFMSVKKTRTCWKLHWFTVCGSKLA